MLSRPLRYLGFCLIATHIYAQSQLVTLHVRNSTNERWFIANYATKDFGEYQPRGGVVIEPRALKTWKLQFHHLPEQWPNSSHKTQIGHLELSRSLDKQHQVYNTADIFIISDAGKERAWTCETFNRKLGCKIINSKTGKTLDLVITKH